MNDILKEEGYVVEIYESQSKESNFYILDSEDNVEDFYRYTVAENEILKNIREVEVLNKDVKMEVTADEESIYLYNIFYKNERILSDLEKIDITEIKEEIEKEIIKNIIDVVEKEYDFKLSFEEGRLVLDVLDGHGYMVEDIKENKIVVVDCQDVEEEAQEKSFEDVLEFVWDLNYNMFSENDLETDRIIKEFNEMDLENEEVINSLDEEDKEILHHYKDYKVFEKINEKIQDSKEDDYGNKINKIKDLSIEI